MGWKLKHPRKRSICVTPATRGLRREFFEQSSSVIGRDGAAIARCHCCGRQLHVRGDGKESNWKWVRGRRQRQRRQRNPCNQCFISQFAHSEKPQCEAMLEKAVPWLFHSLLEMPLRQRIQQSPLGRPTTIRLGDICLGREDVFESLEMVLTKLTRKLITYMLLNIRRS